MSQETFASFWHQISEDEVMWGWIIHIPTDLFEGICFPTDEFGYFHQ